MCEKHERFPPFKLKQTSSGRKERNKEGKLISVGSLSLTVRSRAASTRLGIGLPGDNIMLVGSGMELSGSKCGAMSPQLTSPM